jgi:hypothetical protein
MSHLAKEDRAYAEKEAEKERTKQNKRDPKRRLQLGKDEAFYKEKTIRKDQERKYSKKNGKRQISITPKPAIVDADSLASRAAYAVGAAIGAKKGAKMMQIREKEGGKTYGEMKLRSKTLTKAEKFVSKYDNHPMAAGAAYVGAKDAISNEKKKYKNKPERKSYNKSLL